MNNGIMTDDVCFLGKKNFELKCINTHLHVTNLAKPLINVFVRYNREFVIIYAVNKSSNEKTSNYNLQESLFITKVT
jgi:hypothetical protein